MKKRIYILILIMIMSILVGCSNEIKETTPIKVTEFVLGTIVDIQIYDEKDQEAVKLVTDRLREIEALMTINKEESDLQNLNKSGAEGYVVNKETYKVIEDSLKYAEMSNGMFDPTIGPLIKLWNIGTDDARVPEQTEIESALPLVNYKNVKLIEGNKVVLKEKNMIIDLGSIAKGYAADVAVEILKENKVERAIINLGGNIYALGDKGNGDPWKIGIQDPFSDRGEYLGVVSIANQTVVTSGIYERYFEEGGKRYHHIINPNTGYPVNNELASVTIVSDSSIDADALSTTTFVMGRDEGLKLIESIDNCEAIFVTKDKDIIVSSGLKNNFVQN